MENPITQAKKDLINWISHIDDLQILSDLMELKEKNDNENIVSEPEIVYQTKDDFDERFAKGMSSEKARELSKNKVREWWGK